MEILSDARVLWSLVKGQPGGEDHAKRLEGFYGPQAAHYDRFRERLLQGRGELLNQLCSRVESSGVQSPRLVELGAGTGRNLAFVEDRIEGFGHIELVDLCQPLLDQARKRWRDRPQVHVTLGDATRFEPDRPVDAVYLSYSLTMIPDWFKAVDNALAMLKPGGILGVVDFYVARKYPEEGLAQHGGFPRHFWPLWFAHDGVRPNQDLLPYLRAHAECLSLQEQWARVPYLMGLKVPYFVFIGRKRG